MHLQVEHGLPEPTLPHQWDTYSSTAKFTLQSGAYGSGKTLTNAWIILRECLEHPGTLGLAGAETTPQLKETLQADFEALIAGYMLAGLVKYHGSDRKYTFWNGSQVLFWPLVGGDAKRQRHRIRSLNLGFAVIEEVTSIPEATVLEVLGRLRRKIGSRRLYASCNPDNPEHYLHGWFVDDPKEGFQLVKSNTYANPFLPADYIRALEQSLGHEMAQRYLRGEWVNFEGLVYKDFRRETHIIEPKPLTGMTRWAALDFGGANPHALLWFAEDSQGYVYVTGEWYEAQVGLDAVAAAIKKDEVSVIYRDHDVADSLTLERTYNVRGLRPAKKEKMPGIATVQQFLKPVGQNMQPRVRIFNSCKNLIRELGRYKWPEGTSARDPGNEPVKKDDHALDALRYGLHTRYFQPGGIMTVNTRL
ncbi:PBSX family phage terminase large subunit [Deinococcus peraridilitoris]|uniref:Phage terminase large subunit n=1 Tax=Deinococcus peraridilitoris (strain DSM 19664 / LMG 22246 / CIP 109416 / KR-200) TaxID=937777 RepID=L0A0Y8_DEIPD|nr:phage terminase large subunit [Deinococcus peraridilitoris]AFZ67563.1 phage terminase large subunit [Deinococcus peraridilitoris DSM 19664]